MRRLSPSPQLLDYLDYELEGKLSPVVQPSRPGPRLPRRAALVAAGLAFVLAGVGVATLALAQDAGTPGEDPARGQRRTPVAERSAPGTAVRPRGEAAPATRRRRRARQEAAPVSAPVESPEPNETVGAPWFEEVTEPYSCCALQSIRPSGVPPLKPRDPQPRWSGSVASSRWVALLGAFLLALAVALVFVPDPVRRWVGRRRKRERSRHMAVESRRGGRRSNEDRSTAFSVGEYDALIVADGMGGHIGGARAASIAVETAREYLMRRLPLARDTELVEDLVRSAFVHAAEALAAEDADIGLGGRGVDALRTTLIVAVATSEQYVVGAQGDGGAWVQRATGISVPLMKPAKGDAANIVTASLGPTPEGQVEITTRPRRPGDLLVVCSDGVADRVSPDFDEALRVYADDMVAANEIVRPILDSFEERPTVFDDNLTLGLLVTP